MKFLRLCGALVLVLAGAGAVADNRPLGTDVAEIQRVINRQIEAFRREDAAQAFALISPGAQKHFDNPKKFLRAVRLTYEPIALSVSVQFRDPQAVSGDVMQEVLLADGAGNVTTAYFVAQRQRDGNWRISGCVLARTTLIWT
jgi:uncharacterized protein DUF4864